jgi:hypothetical protein
VEPYAGGGSRHLYLSLKVAETPSGYPRRPGMARKRPLRAGHHPQVDRSAPNDARFDRGRR